MMKMNRKALVLLASVLLAASAAGCGDPAENGGSTLEAMASLPESGKETGTGPDAGEPAATAEPTAVPTAEPTAEPTVEPTAEPTTTPAEESTDTPTPSPEEQTWIDAVYASYINFLNARAQANAKLMEGDIDGYTGLREPAYNDFTELLGVPESKDGLEAFSTKLSPYAYDTGIEQKGKNGIYLLQTSDGMHLGLMFMDDDTGTPGLSDDTDSLWVVVSENPKTHYGLEVIWVRNNDTASGDKLTELETSGIEKDTTTVLNQACTCYFE